MKSVPNANNYYNIMHLNRTDTEFLRKRNYNKHNIIFDADVEYMY